MNDQKCSRRDFTRNVAKLGFVGAVAALLGLKSKHADAGDYCTYYWESRPVSACQSKRRQVTVCNGIIVGYGPWSYYSANNCAYYGFGPRCCG